MPSVHMHSTMHVILWLVPRFWTHQGLWQDLRSERRSGSSSSRADLNSTCTNGFQGFMMCAGWFSACLNTNVQVSKYLAVHQIPCCFKISPHLYRSRPAGRRLKLWYLSYTNVQRCSTYSMLCTYVQVAGFSHAAMLPESGFGLASHMWPSHMRLCT